MDGSKQLAMGTTDCTWGLGLLINMKSHLGASGHDSYFIDSRVILDLHLLKCMNFLLLQQMVVQGYMVTVMTACSCPLQINMLNP